MKVRNIMKMANLKMNQMMLKRAKKFIQSLNQSQTLNLSIHTMLLIWKGLIIKVMTVLVSSLVLIDCKKWQIKSYSVEKSKHLHTTYNFILTFRPDIKDNYGKYC